MSHRKHGRRSAYQIRIVLLVIMIGFCILALAAIVRGQKEIRKDQERLALMEKFNQVLEEETDGILNAGETILEEEEDTNLQQAADGEEENSSQDVQERVPESEETENGGTEPEETDPSYDMQIVFLGDSIFDDVREHNGVATLVGSACNARVYNLSMGGTTAALLEEEQYDFDHWESRSLLGIVNAIVGNISGDIFEEYKAGELLKECNFAETDYFVIEYGINDFFSRVPVSRHLEDGTKISESRTHTYVGALEVAIDLLHGKFPDAKIMLINPHYCNFFNGETYLGNIYTLDYGLGTLADYSYICGYVYDTYKAENVIFFDAFQESDIKAETADWYLRDGIHLNSDGRKLYAECISRLILADFNPVE